MAILKESGYENSRIFFVLVYSGIGRDGCSSGRFLLDVELSLNWA